MSKATSFHDEALIHATCKTCAKPVELRLSRDPDGNRITTVYHDSPDCDRVEIELMCHNPRKLGVISDIART